MEKWEERLARIEELVNKNAEIVANSTVDLEEIKRINAETSKMVNGISHSNGKMAEDYFYNYLEKTMTFGGLDFMDIDKGVRRARKLAGDAVVVNDKNLKVY